MKSATPVPFFAAAAVMLSLALLLLPGEVGARGGHRKMSNYHSEYRAAAKPYSGVQLDRKLPFVPLYRYPVKRYLIGKRAQDASSEEENEDEGEFDEGTWNLVRYLLGYQRPSIGYPRNRRSVFEWE